MFSRISILGGGLLGGSLALALGKLEAAPSVRIWFRRKEVLPQANDIGIPGATSNLTEAVDDAELLVLAVPVGAMQSLVAQAITVGLPPSCLVTDVGSVKSLPHESLQPVLGSRGMHFIGSHPMAGSEQKGLGSADRSLFDNAACLLCNDGGAPEDLCSRLENFWRQVGCRTTWMPAKEHDALVAAISHLPHISAASTARIGLNNPSLGKYGGGGLRDTTRVASGDPDMWAEILTENRAALAPLLKDLIADLSKLADFLDQGAHDATREWLGRAKELRDQIKPNTMPSS